MQPPTEFTDAEALEVMQEWIVGRLIPKEACLLIVRDVEIAVKDKLMAAAKRRHKEAGRRGTVMDRGPADTATTEMHRLLDLVASEGRRADALAADAERWAAAYGIATKTGDALAARVARLEALLRRGDQIVARWQEWYGAAEELMRLELPLPPSGPKRAAP